MNHSKISAVAYRFPLFVVVSVRKERSVDHRVKVDTVETHRHVENFVVGGGTENLLKFYHSILTTHTIVEDVCLTGIRGILRRDSIDDHIDIISILF